MSTEELFSPEKSGGGKSKGFEARERLCNRIGSCDLDVQVQRFGDSRVALIGFPSADAPDCWVLAAWDRHIVQTNDNSGNVWKRFLGDTHVVWALFFRTVHFFAVRRLGILVRL